MLSHFAVIFPVNNISDSVNFYTSQLGFNLKFEMNGYAVVERDEAVQIHFSKNEGDFKPSSHHNAIYIFTHNVDQLYQEFRSRQIKILNPPTTWEYGMRDFDIEDPNGFKISFGQSVTELNSGIS